MEVERAEVSELQARCNPDYIAFIGEVRIPCCFKEGKQLATSRECKFIETSSGIQHNVDELLVGVLKQIRLRETRDKKLKRQGSKGKILSKLHGSKTALSLNLARDIFNKMCLNDSKSKSCENLHVL